MRWRVRGMEGGGRMIGLDGASGGEREKGNI